MFDPALPSPVYPCHGQLVRRSLQVRHLLGRPLQRHFPWPRKVQRLQGGLGLHIVAPPQPRENTSQLCFVAVRLALPVHAHRVPAGLLARLNEVVFVVAMQFGGYIFKRSDTTAELHLQVRSWETLVSSANTLCPAVHSLSTSAKGGDRPCQSACC